MKNTLALSILKVEGIGEQLGCYLNVDGGLVGIVSILDTLINENCTEVPVSGVLKILVKPQGSSEKAQCSVSINIQALPAEGTVWLPLYSGSCSETLPQIPSALPHTKMLISVNQLGLLTPVPEITEYDSSFFDIENSLCKTFTEKSAGENHDKCRKAMELLNEKNKELRIKALEMENELQRYKEESDREKSEIVQVNHNCFSKLAIQLEKYKLQCESLKAIHEDHVLQVNSLQTLFKQETLQREHIEKQLLRITKEFQDYARGYEEKVFCYEQSMKNKDREIEILRGCSSIPSNFFDIASQKDMHTHNLQEQLHNCIESLQESEFQRKIMQEKLEAVADFHSKELEELISAPPSNFDQKLEEVNKSLMRYKQRIVELENMLDDRYVESNVKENDDGSKGTTTKNPKLVEEVSALKELLAQEKRNSGILLQQLREKGCKEIESKLKGADEKFIEYLRNYEIEEKFERVTEGVFSYGNKRVSVAIKNGCLICRIGGGYMGIEKFLKMVNQEKERITPTANHKRSQTAAVLKDKSPRDDIQARVNNQKYNFAKISTNSKENAEDILKYPATVSNKLSYGKEKSFTPGKEVMYKRVYK